MKLNIPNNHAHHHNGGSQNVFDNPELFIEKFDGPDRDKWQKPTEVIEAFDISPDAVIVEIGAGTGYFAIRLAEQVKDGDVIAFEQAPKMADYLRDRVSKLGLRNIDVRMTDSDGSLSLEKPVDLIFSVDVYHHISDRVAYFANVRQHLKPDGVLIVIDRSEEIVEGQPSGHRVPASKVKEEMKEAGYTFTQELELLLPVQYYLAFKRTI